MEETLTMGTTSSQEGLTFADEYENIANGEYEFEISAEKKSYKNGTVEALSVKYIIREDVDQKFKKRVIFETIFKDKSNPKWFDTDKLRTLVCTQSTGKGWKVNFLTCDDCIQYINGIHLRATVETVCDEYTNYEEKTRIKYKSQKPSEWDKTHPASASVEETISDLPF